MKDKRFFLLLIIMLIAGFFRLWQITALPGGLFPDEAANGLDIVYSIFQGHHSPFFERGLGREALFFYLQAVSVALFGIGVWQIHIVSAVIGILTVFFVYLLAKKLFSSRVAFFAAFFLATSTWHVTLSRTGFRAIMVPLLSTMFFYFCYLAFKANNRKLLFAVLAGASLGLGFYTYVAFRAIIPILFALTLFAVVFHRKILFKFRREIIAGIFAMIIILIPLTIYFAIHPDSFVGRAGYVSIFNPDLNQGDIIGTFIEVAKKTFLMFFTEGDLNWRHNVSGFGMLNPLAASLFAAGFIFSVFLALKAFFVSPRKAAPGNLKETVGTKYFKYFFLIVWFLGMLGPELMTAEAIPHGLRAIGVLGPVFFFPALMIDFFWKKAAGFSKIMKSALFLLLAVFLAASLLYDYYLYFGINANSPGFYYAYRSDLTVVSDYLNERELKEKTYLSLDDYSVQTPEFLTAKKHQPYILINPEKSYKVNLREGEQIIFTQSTIFDAAKFEESNPEAKIVKKEYNKFKQEIMRVYEIP